MKVRIPRICVPASFLSVFVFIVLNRESQVMIWVITYAIYYQQMFRVNRCQALCQTKKQRD